MSERTEMKRKWMCILCALGMMLPTFGCDEDDAPEQPAPKPPTEQEQPQQPAQPDRRGQFGEQQHDRGYGCAAYAHFRWEILRHAPVFFDYRATRWHHRRRYHLYRDGNCDNRRYFILVGYRFLLDDHQSRHRRSKTRSQAHRRHAYSVYGRQYHIRCQRLRSRCRAQYLQSGQARYRHDPRVQAIEAKTRSLLCRNLRARVPLFRRILRR